MSLNPLHHPTSLLQYNQFQQTLAFVFSHSNTISRCDYKMDSDVVFPTPPPKTGLNFSEDLLKPPDLSRLKFTVNANAKAREIFGSLILAGWHS